MGLTHYPPDCFCTRSMFILKLSLVHGVDALSSRLSSDGVDAVSPPLDTGLTLFPPRHVVDAVSPQTRGWRCFPQTQGWSRIPQTVFSTWGWCFIPHNILCIGSTLSPLTALASGSPIVRLSHLRLATPKEIAKCFYVDVILYLITRGPRATVRSSEWHNHCRYADVMQHFSNPIITTVGSKRNLGEIG